MNNRWYFISYNLPTEPSRIRVKVWRLLKRFGAINIQQSLWVLPLIDGLDKKIKKLKEEILKEGGSLFVVLGEALEGEENLISRFQNESKIEYTELEEYCQMFLHEMKEETDKENFTFIELEENDEELKKLIKWYDRISKRDFFNCQKGIEIDEKLNLCKKEFEDFSSKIYIVNGIK